MTGRPRMAALAALLVAAFAVTVAAGCGSAPDVSIEVPPTPTPTPATTATPTPTADPGSVTPGVAATIVDPSLLAILPSRVRGFDVRADPETAAELAADPTVVATVEALASAVVVDPTTGDFAYISIVRLRPGLFDDAFHRSWRDSFDEGACRQAGGPERTAQADIGGWTTWITTCAGGLRTYNVHVPAPDRIVSISSIGEERFGEAIVRGLRP